MARVSASIGTVKEAPASITVPVLIIDISLFPYPFGEILQYDLLSFFLNRLDR